MQAIICLIALVLLFNATLSGAQEDGSPFVRLATYWDSPGDVKAISADDRWMVITDHATEISRLVEIATGDILTEQPRNDVIWFSPDGRFASVYDVASGNIQIIDLAHKAVTYEEPVGRILIRFSANSRYGVAGFTDSDRQNYHVQVMNLETGEVLIDVPVTMCRCWMRLIRWGVCMKSLQANPNQQGLTPSPKSGYARSMFTGQR